MMPNAYRMFNFDLGETADAIRETVHAFSSNEIAPRAAEIDRSNHFPRDLLPKLASLRLHGIPVADAYGGSVLGYRQRDVIQPDRIIATPADERALAWVRDHTPADAVFLASGQPTYGDTVVLGEDGGWWLPVLADRACTVPPLPIGHELTVEPDYRQRTVDLAKAVAADLGAPDTVARLQREGVEWAYVGPTAKTLTAGKLEAAGWRMVYDEDGASVWVAAWGGGSGGEGLGPPPVDQAP